MKILSVQQVRDWDKFTIQQKPISSINLMENAARACADWIKEKYGDKEILIVCGKGNNGGDGLAIARILNKTGLTVSVIIIDTGKEGSADFEINRDRLQTDALTPLVFSTTEDNLSITENTIIIDAIFGSGLSRPVEGVEKFIIEKINHSGKDVIAIDIPSGLFADESSGENTVIEATHTLSFQSPKMAFMIAENEKYIGEIRIFDIGLEKDFVDNASSDRFVTDDEIIQRIYKPRKTFSHKGNFGHALLLGGSRGKMGAAVLCAKACAHAGSGLVTTYLPAAGVDIMQVSVPEVMCMSGEGIDDLQDLPEDLDKYQSIGVGPGIGKSAATVEMIRRLLEHSKKPIVIDADALNIISKNSGMLELIPQNSILTPHPKEFERLFGKTANEFERIALAVTKSIEHNIIIVLKGHHTQVSLPNGMAYFNNTGNSGMAKGGSGDVLTGIITSLLGQGYEPGDAAIFSVHIHGLAGDLAAEHQSQESMLPGDLIAQLGAAYFEIKKGTR